MDWREHIHSDSNILLGKPVIKNTRISVELILELLAVNWSEQQILDNYPTLKQNDIKAVYLYLKRPQVKN